MRDWCNGSTRVFQTFSEGSIPLSRSNQMIKIAPFTNAVFVEELDYVLTSIESAIIDLKNRIPGETYSNRGGWQSKSYTRYEKPFMAGLIDSVTTKVQEVYKDLGITKEPTLGNYWFNINEKYHYNTAHNHPGSYVSAVLYVKAPKDCGELVIERPDPFVDWIHEYENNENNVTKIKQIPREKLLIIFPAYMRHYVEANMSDDVRISIAFNFK